MQIQFNVYLIIVGCGFLYGLVSYKMLSGPFRVLFWLIGYVFIMELGERYIFPHFFENTSFIYHINVFVIIVLNTLIYSRLNHSNKKLKRLILYLSIICEILVICNSLFYQKITLFPSFSISIQGFLSIALSLLTFLEMLKMPTKIPLLKQAIFWFNSGTFFFCGFSFVSFVFYNEFLEEEKGYWLLYVNLISNYILYSFYLIALYFNQKTADER